MDDHAKKLRSSLEKLRENDAFVDFTIQVEESEFHVHKVILASMSFYFETMLMIDMKESQMDRVNLDGFSCSTVASIIKYMYTGELDDEHSTAEELFQCAEYLQMEPGISKCVQLILEGIHEHNCYEILSIFRAYSNTAGIHDTEKYIRTNINGSSPKRKPEQMPFTEFVCFMDFWEEQQWDLFDKANLWLSADFEKRIQHLNDVMNHIDFAGMSKQQLQSVKESFTFQNFEGSWRDLVDEGLEFHNLPVHRQVIQPIQKKDEAIAVCFNAKEPKTFYSLCSDMYWTNNKALNAPKFEVGIVASVVVNNYLVVCQRLNHKDISLEQKWYIFNPRTLEWSEVAKLKTPREAFALAAYDGYLYALGGIQVHSKVNASKTDCIEKYDFKTNKWVIHPTSLLVKLSHHVACVLDNCIYVAGGACEHDLFDRIDCYNVLNDTWSSQSMRPFCTPDFLLPLDIGSEKLILVVLTEKLRFYNPTTGEFSNVNRTWSKEKFGNSCDIAESKDAMALASGNTVFFLNYKCYEPENSESENEFYYGCGADEEPKMYEKGCLKWTFSGRDEIKAQNVNDFPFGEGVNTLSVMLAFPPYMVKSNNSRKK